MSKLDHADIVRGIRGLPALPVVVAELIRSFEQPDVSTAAVASTLSRDQALAAKTLRLANSPFYGLARKVRTIQQAIAVIGFDAVRSMIVTVGMMDIFAGTGDEKFNFTAFWRHAIGTALCARALARLCNQSQTDSFIAGLMHDIGRLVLVTRFPREYAVVMTERAARDCHALEAERDVLGTDHAVVGRSLADHWKFPGLIQNAIANHHAPMAADLGDIPAIVHVANAIAHGLDLSGDEDDLVPPVSAKAWDSLRLNPAELPGLFRDVENEFNQVCQILAVR